MQPYNVDINARRADYKSLPKDTVLVSKVFKTIQSEGPLSGTPAIFIRTSGCNLGAKEQCPFCDSQFFIKSGTPLTITEIIERVREIRRESRLIVLTGGEPLLQPSAPALIRSLLHEIYGAWVQIETNGYFWSPELGEIKSDYGSDFVVVVSPKVNQRQVYPDLPKGMAIDCLKILVDADPSSPYHELPPYTEPSRHSDRVMISPIMHYRKQPNPRDERVSFLDPDTPLDIDRCRANIAYASALALDRGYRLSLQTHLLTGAE